MNENGIHYVTEDEYYPQPNIVKCPRCDYEFIHQLTVEVFDHVEDQEHGLYVKVSQGEMNVMSELPVGNPSKRRDGLRILFGCESCGQVSSLVIYQHKGLTTCEWEIDKEWVEETKKWNTY
jgi:hypothetical protein